MPLSPEDFANMDAALGVKPSFSPDLISEMDAALAGLDNNQQQGTDAGAGYAFGYGFSGGQIPFGNVITSGIGAGIAKVASPFTGDERTLGQLYDQAQMDTKATQEANPNATLAGNIAGIVSTLPAAFSKPVQGAGIIATPAKGLQNLGNFTGKMVSATPFKGSGMLAGAGNFGTRMVGGAAVSAPVGGLYAAGEADAGNRMEALGKGASTGAALGAAFPVAGALVGSSLKGVSNAYKGITARGEVSLEDAFQGIKDAGSKLYKATEQAGVLAKPDAAKTLIDDLSGIIKTKDIASQRLYSHTLRSIKDLEDDVLSGNTGLMTLDRHRQILGNISKDITNPNKAQEAEAAGRAIDVIDDFVDNLTPDKLINGTTEAVESLVNARSLWAKSKRFEKIASFVNNAGNDANKFKRDLEKFRLNPKNTLGWSDAEKEALKAASSQTTGEGVLKALGKFGFDIGSGRAPGNTVGAVIGSAVAGTASGALAPAALVPIVGTAARTTHKLITFGKAEELLKVIEQGGKVTNQMVAKLPKSEQKKFLSEVMQMPVAKAQAIFGEKIKPAMQKSKQFAKDYIADESGALNIGGDYINDATDYFVKKAKENGFDIGDISRSLNRNKERSNYMNMSRLGQVRISDHLSNPNFNTSKGNIVVSEKDYKNQIDNFLDNIKSGIDKQKNEQNVIISNVNLDGLMREMAELKSKKTRLSDYKYESRLRDLEKKYNLPAFELNKSYIHKKIFGGE